MSNLNKAHRAKPMGTTGLVEFAKHYGEKESTPDIGINTIGASLSPEEQAIIDAKRDKDPQQQLTTMVDKLSNEVRKETLDPQARQRAIGRLQRALKSNDIDYILDLAAQLQGMLESKDTDIGTMTDKTGRIYDLIIKAKRTPRGEKENTPEVKAAVDMEAMQERLRQKLARKQEEIAPTVDAETAEFNKKLAAQEAQKAKEAMLGDEEAEALALAEVKAINDGILGPSFLRGSITKREM